MPVVCAICVRLYKAREQPATKGVRTSMRILKAIMIVTVLAGALSLGACAEKKRNNVDADDGGFDAYLLEISVHMRTALT